MTYKDVIDGVTQETIEALDKWFDGEVNTEDFMETMEAGMAWNAALKVPGLTRKQLIAHVVARLPQYAVGELVPLPEGEVPTTP